MHGSQSSCSPWSNRVAPLIAAAIATAGCASDEGDGAQAAAPPAPAVVVAQVRAETVPIFRAFVARTEAVETIEIQARAEAILLTKEFEEGRPVTEGQVLYRLDERTYAANLAVAEAQVAQAIASLKLAEENVTVRAAQASLVRAQATLKKTQQDVARLRPLAEKDAVPRQDLDTALAAEEVAAAEVEAAEADLKNSRITEEVGILTAKAAVDSARAEVELAKLDLEYCTISSPIAGLIGRTEVDVGNLVGRGEATVLATVSRIDPMYVTMAISEEEYLQTESGRKERGEKGEDLPFDLILADDSVFDQKGTFVIADRAVAVETGTLQLVLEFPNPEGTLRPGQFARVRGRVGLFEDAVLVPQRAVMEQQGTKIVFVVGEGDVVALRTLQVADRYEDYFVVADGLAQGERVIVEGQLKARPGMTVDPKTEAVSSEPARGE